MLVQKTTISNVRNVQGKADKLLVREFCEEDRPAVLSLFRETLVDSEQYTDDYWDWMYCQNPLKSAIIWVAVDGEKLVGHYALIPLEMTVNGAVRTGATAVNIAVHPDYQGKGIFPRLVAAAAEQAGRDGVVLSYVFPNERAYPIFTRKLGWVKVGSLRTLVRPLDVAAILRHRCRSRFQVKALAWLVELFLGLFFRPRQAPLPAGTEITEVSSFDGRIDGFWEKVRGGFRVMPVRDRQYLTWRFVKKPVRSGYEILLAECRGETLGYLVVKSKELEGNTAGAIMDILTLPGREDVARCLISRAIQRCREAGAETLNCDISRTNPYYGSFRKSGFMPFPEGVPRLAVQTNCAELSLDFLGDPENWFITIGGGNWL